MNGKETVEEPVLEVAIDVEEPILDDVTWFNDLVNAEKDPLTFDDLMDTPIDFTNFAINRLKKDKIIKVDLVGPVYKLLKGTCRRNMKRKYFASITKTKAARYDLEGIEDMIPRLSQINKISRHIVYSTMKILSVIRVKDDKQFGYGYLEKIVVRRADKKEYTFKEGDFPRLHLNDIEDMLLLHVQNKLFNLPGNDIVDLVIALCMFTRSPIIKKRVKDVQLGVESYKKKLNITKPQTTFDGISYKETYTTIYDPKGVVYLTRANERD
ncbi:hypothetical protein Tco_1447949 [Tanacetum coccineum]